MRGTENCREARKVREGITPAHAGNRKYIRRMNTADRDHPRTCGEQSARKTEWNFSRGSPPHMRGTGQSPKAAASDNRITPAHAGNSISPARRSWSPWDHPRTCGEQPGRLHGHLFYIGSPPHMRGTGEDIAYFTSPVGITPAHAGNSLVQNNFKTTSRDHPRTCGEQTAAGWVAIIM